MAIAFSNIAFAQDFYDTYPQDNYNGYEYYNTSYEYPEDYYYNYPQDYYPENYYQSYYNDYRQAIYSVDWNVFFMQYNLNPWQINQILILNNRFASYDAWNSYYRWNPDRWYYDRFYAMQSILGPNVFVIYQNVYYQGRSPITYYYNHRVNFYVNRYPVRPVYRNVNINIYRVNRNDFRAGFRTPPRNTGLLPNRNNNNPRSGANGGFRSPNQSNEVRANNSSNNNVGIRNQNLPSNNRNDGFRNSPSQNNERRINDNTRTSSSNSSGFRVTSR